MRAVRPPSPNAGSARERPSFQRRRLARRLATIAAIFVFGLALGIAVYRVVAARALDREIARTPRDGATGIAIGTEPCEVGPVDAAGAVLLLHGYLGSRKDLADLADRLVERGWFVREPLLPGHGRTPRDLAAVGVEESIEAARAELAGLRERFDRVAVVGFSMGGSLATILAAEGGVDRVVLVAPYYEVTHRWFYVLPPGTWNAMLSPVLPYVMKTDGFIKINRREAIPNIFTYRTVPTRSARELAKLGLRAQSAETLAAIDCPVLLLHSEGDRAADPAASRRAFEAIGAKEKQSRFYTERSNHLLLWDYDAEDVKERVLAFLGNP